MSPGVTDREARPIALRDILVIGGGCYGSFYAGQLARARRVGRLIHRHVLVVDRDPACSLARAGLPDAATRLVTAEWGAFLDEFLDRPPPDPGEPDDAVVPSPLMPHLMAAWLAREARRLWPGREVGSCRLEPAVGTPYDRAGPDGTRYLSFADWLCPTHCVEPHQCPVTRGPRTWEMAEAVTAYAARLAHSAPVAGTAVFVTRHRVYGVGMFDVAEARAARQMLSGAGPGAGTVVVATVSSCHGALSGLELGPVPPP